VNGQGVKIHPLDAFVYSVYVRKDFAKVRVTKLVMDIGTCFTANFKEFSTDVPKGGELFKFTEEYIRSVAANFDCRNMEK
jgi:hypothetical protein